MVLLLSPTNVSLKKRIYRKKNYNLIDMSSKIIYLAAVKIQKRTNCRSEHADAIDHMLGNVQRSHLDMPAHIVRLAVGIILIHRH